MYGPGVPGSVFVFLDRLPRLERLRMHVLDAATLEQIGRLDGLKSLHQCSLPLPPLPIPIHSRLFSDVHELNGDNVTVEQKTQFFNLYVETAFTSITITYAVTSVINGFYSSLTCRRSHRSLVALDLNTADLTPSFHENPTSYSPYPATLRLLFCFTNLTKLSISCALFDLDDNTLSEMAHAWLHLQTLRLAGHAIFESRVTLRGLRFLARYYPYLESLHMTFDASTIPPLENSAEPHISQTSLILLNVAHSTIFSPPPVARFLSGIFPHLRYIYPSCDNGDDEDEDNVFVIPGTKYSRTFL
jgi:hypothetical protein